MRTAGRRHFLEKASLLAVGAVIGKISFSPAASRASKRQPIHVTDKYITFVEQASAHQKKEIPEGFIHTHHPSVPEVPRVQEVDFPWGKETFTNGSLGAIGQLGAVNEGIHIDGARILQIVASTPGTPDSGSGSPQYKNWYRISSDNGRSFSEFRLIVAEGLTKENPLPGVVIGRNGFTTPFTSPILKSAAGEIIVPVNLHPWDDQNQRIYNPADAFLFGDSGVLTGKWNHNSTDIIWSFGNWLRIDHNRSTRGLFEPSLAELRKTRTFAMVMRGSNYKRPELPSYAWVSFSSDQCRSWSTPEPFTYSDGIPFFVPASCSTLFRSRHTGTLYWVGNLIDKNPDGNHPRNPLVIGQVDEDHFGLIRSTVVEIDRYRPESEESSVELSNFKILEHKSLNEIVVALTRRIKSKWAKDLSWYRIVLS